MPSHLIELILQALDLAEESEQQAPPSIITLAALQHALMDAVAEVESIRNRLQQSEQ
jgi:hypothetical protein